MSRAAWLNGQHGRSCALVLTLFLFQKGQGFFPPLPIAALPRRSRRGAYASLAGWDASVWVGRFCSVNEWADFLFPAVGGGQASPLRVEMLRCSLGIFAVQKGQRDFDFTLALVASHEARRRMAVYTMQLSGRNTRPASREACRRAAVKPRPTGMSHEQPRAQWARCGVQGYYPC